MHKIINLTPEKNASRSIGEYINEILNTNVNYIDSYGLLTETEWLDFDNLVNESIVFMFVRNPYDRLVSSFIHMCLSLDYVSDYPEWYFDLSINHFQILNLNVLLGISKFPIFHYLIDTFLNIYH